MMVVLPGVTAQIRAASAMKGYCSRPNSAHTDRIFSPASMLRKLSIYKQLLQDGLAFHTLQPLGENSFRVHVFADNTATVAAIDKAATHFGAKVKADKGSGEFIGTTKDTGTDREQRDDAKQAYERVIRDVGNSGALGGHNVGELWKEIRDHWNRSKQRNIKAPGPGYSADARLIDAAIHASNVYDAQRALAENRKSRLMRRRAYARDGRTVERAGAGHDVSDEPRDERGRWTSGAGSSDYETQPRASRKAKPRHIQVIYTLNPAGKEAAEKVAARRSRFMP